MSQHDRIDTRMVRDADGAPIPTLGTFNTYAHPQLDTDAVHDRTVTPFAEGVAIIWVITDQPIRYKLGDENVVATANDHFLPAGGPFAMHLYDKDRKRASHISVLKAGATAANVNISEMI